jgi:hypothetical protein
MKKDRTKIMKQAMLETKHLIALEKSEIERAYQILEEINLLNKINEKK